MSRKGTVHWQRSREAWDIITERLKLLNVFFAHKGERERACPTKEGKLTGLTGRSLGWVGGWGLGKCGAHTHRNRRELVTGITEGSGDTTFCMGQL